MRARFRELATWVGRAIEPRSWRVAREREEAHLKEKNDARLALKARMKPNDDTIGYMQDPDKPIGVVIAVNYEKLSAHCVNKRPQERLDRSRIRFYGKAIKANNNLHLMATIYVTAEGDIRLLEGQHRFQYLAYHKYILVNVVNEIRCSETEFAKHVQLVIDKCGEQGLGLVQQNNAVFCNVEFNDGGHFPIRFEERVSAPYFTIKEPKPSPDQTATVKADAPARAGVITTHPHFKRSDCD